MNMGTAASHAKTIMAALGFALAGVIAAGLFWFFFTGSASPVGFGWYLFSFAAGLTMIVLPCTLPLAFVIVPLSMGKGAAKGLGIAAAFGLGVALTLSAYGVIAAIIGEVAIGTIGAPLETVKNWLYFFAGAAAYLFALGELGLIRVRMPSYSGAAPAFIQKQQDYLKALLLGLFLGNIGVGCPHPATPVILTRIAASGDVFYGWMLFLVHAIGRVIPLLLLALLGILGVNALQWLVARKDKVERATGWGMVFVAGFILVLGLFSHDWWVYSGQHTLFEEITREEQVVGVIAQRLGVAAPHTHEIPTGAGLFGLPFWLGNWTLAVLWVSPLFWYHIRKKKEEGSAPAYRIWFFSAVSFLLALLVIWVLPDRFLNHTRHMKSMPHAEEMTGREHAAADHGAPAYQEEAEVREGIAVNLNVAPVPVDAGTSTRLSFFVNEKPGNRPVDAAALEYDHTKLMHVIGVRDDLNEFFHIHPQPAVEYEGLGVRPGLFTVDHAFSMPGRYKIWSEIKKDGVNYTFGHPEISVEGVGERYEKDVFFARSAIVGNYQVLMEYEAPIAQGRETDIVFDIHDLVGREIAVEPYLDADMHLSVIKDDLTRLIHTHPDGGADHHGLLPVMIRRASAHGSEARPEGEDIKIIFHVLFPEAGIYKMLAQFRPQGIELPEDEALTASFFVRVEEKKSFVFSGWGVNVAVSLALIVLLSWGVKRFLKRDE